MFIKIMVVLLIIIVVFLFLVFFKPWYLHIIFKNNNLEYNYYLKINFLNFDLIISNESTRKNRLLLSVFSKKIVVFDYSSTSRDIKEKVENDQEKNKNLFINFKQLYPLLKNSEEDLFELFKLFKQLISFEENITVMNLGLSDNNLTIKFCTFLWALTAPLYSVGFKFLLTPEINKMIFKSDINIKFKIFLFNILKIMFLVFRRDKLRKILRFLLNR